MRNQGRSESQNKKISIKQLKNQQKQQYHSTGFNYQYGYSIEGEKSGQNFTKPKLENVNQYHYKYPPSHIESESSVDCEKALSYNSRQTGKSRERRRKIFQRKVLRGYVVEPQQNYTNNMLQNPINNQYREAHIDKKWPEQQYFTLKNIEMAKNTRNQSLGPNRNLRITSNAPSSNYQLESPYHEMQGTIVDNLKQFQNSYNFTNQKALANVKNCQKLPSFANQNDQNIYVLEQQTSQRDRQKSMEIQAMLVLSGLPEQVKHLKKQLESQKRQITQLGQKLSTKSNQNFHKQRQLLTSLISKQEQLTKKQYQLNQNLEKMNQIQHQSGQRYERVLKYELELQQAKRLQNLSRQNSRLYNQLLLKNQTISTDLTHSLTQHNQNFSSSMNQNKFANLHAPKLNSPQASPKCTYFPKQKQLQSLDILSPIQGFQNNYNYMANGSKFGNAKQPYLYHNFKDISALQPKYCFDDYQCESSNDETLRELLSPLEIRPFL